MSQIITEHWKLEDRQAANFVATDGTDRAITEDKFDTIRFAVSVAKYGEGKVHS